MPGSKTRTQYVLDTKLEKEIEELIQKTVKEQGPALKKYYADAGMPEEEANALVLGFEEEIRKQIRDKAVEISRELLRAKEAGSVSKTPNGNRLAT